MTFWKNCRRVWGVYLSGGEQQRIALARAILKDAPIVVLDEATAFADPENEHQIQKAFEALTKNKTVLMIAHRLSTVQDADNIIVLSGGKIAEQGSHETLLAQHGVYAAMWADYQQSDEKITALICSQRKRGKGSGESRYLVFCVQCGPHAPCRGGFIHGAAPSRLHGE